MEQYGKVSHVGLDNHRNFSSISARDANNRVVFRQRLDHADRSKLRGELARFPTSTPVILEASFGWGWMADEWTAAGHDPHLASSGKVAAWRKARGMAKSNRTDADLLGELWPEKPRWWEVWLVPPEVRDQREWLRYRMSLVAVQSMTKNRIHATLHRHGILHGMSDLFGTKGRAFLKLVVEADEPLRKSGRETLGGYLKLLEQVRKQIAAVTRELRGQVKKNQEAERWRTMPGIGWVLAYTIQAEVGMMDRFADGRHLASYSLLVPLADDSGDEDGSAPLGRHVGHAGRRTLKWAFIEAAHGAVKKSAFFRGVFDRRTQGGKRDKNRGYIAVARRLCCVGAGCVRNGTDYSETPPVRPGCRVDPATGAAHGDNGIREGSTDNGIDKESTPLHEESSGKKNRKAKRQMKRHSDPGCGQPDDPMAVAGR
jgi:transposase